MPTLKVHVDLKSSKKQRDYLLTVDFVNPHAQLDDSDSYELFCPYLIHLGKCRKFSFGV